MTHLVRHLGATSTAFGLAALLFHPLAIGQTAPAPAAAPAAPAAAVDPSVSDRIKKDAASPLYWIRLNAQKTDSTSSAKPAPRIVEIKQVPRPAAPAVAGGGNPPPAPATAPAAAATTVASGGGGGMGTASDASAAPAARGAELAATLPVGTPAGANLAGTAAASLVAPAAPSATEAARAATQPPPAAEEPDEPLALLKANEPEFPQVAMRRLRKGSVQVRFEVQADGRVANAAIVQTTNKSLNDAALEAVNAWVFKPVRSPRSAVVDLGFDLDS